jgi:hypothetical protein
MIVPSFRSRDREIIFVLKRKNFEPRANANMIFYGSIMEMKNREENIGTQTCCHGIYSEPGK